MKNKPLLLLPLVVFAGACATSTVSKADVELAHTLAEFAEARTSDDAFSGVVLLARNDKPFLQRAYGLADRERQTTNTLATRFNVASLGKMFTAVAVAQLVEEGKLSYDVTIGTYLPDLPNPALRDQVTLHHLLTHTSGVEDIPDELFNDPPAVLSGYMQFLTNAQLEFEPGEKRSYSNTGFVIAGLLIEKVTGENYADWVRRKIFVPARMTATSFEPVGVSIGYERSGATKVMARTDRNEHHGGPHGGTFSTASDLMRFFEALRNGKLVTPAAVTRLTTPQNGASAAYGFGVLPVGSDRLVGHSGGDAGVSADAYHYWRSGYTVVVLSNLSPPASHAVAGQARKLLETRFATPSTRGL